MGRWVTGLAFGTSCKAWQRLTNRPGQVAPSHPSLLWWGTPIPQLTPTGGPPLHYLLWLYHPAQAAGLAPCGGCSGPGALPRDSPPFTTSLTGLLHYMGSNFGSALCQETETSHPVMRVRQMAMAHPVHTPWCSSHKKNCWHCPRHHRAGPNLTWRMTARAALGCRHGRALGSLPLRSPRSFTEPKITSLALIHTVPSSNTINVPITMDIH